MKIASRLSFILIVILVPTLLSGEKQQTDMPCSKSNGKLRTFGQRTHANRSADRGPLPSSAAVASLPSSWDWRDYAGVTPAKNQNPWAGCWAFNTLADLESKVAINEGTQPDYSEINLLDCNNHSTNCNTGGNVKIGVNYLSVYGTVEETCDPFPADCLTSTCNNPSCDFIKTVTEWRMIPNDIAAIKDAVYNYGPVVTVMASEHPSFTYYDGNGCICQHYTSVPAHHVLIIGWDDNECGGNGAWIGKNSWGTAWGDSGFFCIEYGQMAMGEDASVITGYKDFDPDEIIYYNDEQGFMNDTGAGDGDDWGMVEITPDDDGWLTDINTWAVSGPTTFNVYVYDTFSRGKLVDFLGGSGPDTVSNAGLYTLPLDSPIELTAGDPVYIAVRYNVYGYPRPVPYDDSGPMETNKSFVSDDGVTWLAQDAGDLGSGDVSIRARVQPSLPVGAPENPSIPVGFKLIQNTPNPFNPSTEIRYELPAGVYVRLEIFDVSGRKIATLVDQFHEAGAKSVQWDGKGVDGSPLTSGVYFCRLEAGGEVLSKKMILLK